MNPILNKVQNLTLYHIVLFLPAYLVGRMMELSGAVMDAIKNKTYSLKPVQKQTVKRKMVREPQDYNIGEILARRLAMGYGMEEDARSGKSIR